jgi:enterochelin esterase-like enzyme
LALAALTVALLGSGLRPAPALAAGMRLTSFPAAGLPGSQLAVDLAGFPTAQSVTIAIDGNPLANVSVPARTTTEAAVQLPAGLSAGTHALEATDVNGLVLAQTPFTVTSTADAAVVERSFASVALAATVRLAVYLPPGYATSSLRYPVLYFLHGLPASPTAYRSWMPIIQRAMSELGGSGAIVVIPQAARAGDRDPEYHDWGRGRNWETELAVELPRVVDATYRTIPTRRGRALIGVSAGGYGAFALGLHHLDTFAALESWSGYFEPTDASGRVQLDLGSAAANARATAFTIVPDLARVLARMPTFIGFYVGLQDALFRSDNIRLHDYLAAEAVPHTFSLYPGGHHADLWSAQATAWIEMALGQLSPAA